MSTEVADSLAALATRVEDLGQRLERLEARVTTLEEPSAHVEQSTLREPEASTAEDVEPLVEATDGSDLIRLAGLLGRTFVVLGGGYLLRALTESGAVPRALGIGLGLAYAGLWALAADRSGRSGRRRSAAFHGAAAAMVAFPLLWETTARFEALTPAVTALVLAAMAASLLAIAWRHRLPGLAWVAAIGSTGASLALMLGTRSVEPFALFQIALGIGALWLGRFRTWTGLGGTTALVADLAGVIVVLGALLDRITATTSMIVLLLLAVLYVGSFIGLRIRGFSIGVFEAFQGAVALVIGLGGAVAVIEHLQLDPTRLALGSACVLLGLLGYWIAITRERWQEGEAGPHLFLSGTAFALVALGVLLLGHLGPSAEATVAGHDVELGLSTLTRLAGAAPVLTWSALGVLAALIGDRRRLNVLLVHGLLYGLLAAVTGGLVHRTWIVLTADATVVWPAITASGAAALVGLALCTPFASIQSPLLRRTRRTLKLLAIAVVVAGAGAMVLRLVAAMLPAPPGPDADAGAIATLRTAILSTGVLAAAGLSHWQRLRQAAYLVVPVLVLIGIKLLVEDFPSGRPSTLFITLALYGGALIAAPRLTRWRTPDVARDDGIGPS